MSRACHRCGREIGAIERIGRRDTCLACGSDLHCCRNCRFHDPTYHNECREPQAERQVDKEQGNFCEYFNPDAAPRATTSPAADARSGLERLFAGRKRS